LLGIIISGVDVVLPLQREPTAVEQALLRLLSLSFGLGGAYVLGRRSARDAARELMQPHARSAFRRLLSLYFSLGRVAQHIDLLRAEGGETNAESGYRILHAIVTEQLATAGDALEDWRDIVPEDVAELEARLTSGKFTGPGVINE
jgi:hypothetical protein